MYKKKISGIMSCIICLIYIGAFVFIACKSEPENDYCSHTFGNWTPTLHATCITAGSQERICSKCGEKETDAISALGHNVEWAVKTAATATTNMVETGTCTRCFVTEERTIINTYLGNLDNSYFELITPDNTSYRIVRSDVLPPNEVYIPATYKGLPVTEIGIENVGNSSNAAFSNRTNIIELYIPNSITEIHHFSFHSCSNLTSVTIPESVTYIGLSAFSYCDNLESITIPASVTQISSGAFSLCRNLTSINVDTNNPNFVDEDGILYDKAKTVLYCYPAGKSGSSFTVPSNVTFIYASAFGGTTLERITIQDGVTTIDGNVFNNCTNLKNITIASSVTSIGWSAFVNSGTAPLTIIMGGNAPSVGTDLFQNISSSRTVTVKVPSVATGYGNSPTDTTTDNWGNAFRGKGWNRNNGTYFSGTVNANIILTIEYMDQ